MMRRGRSFSGHERNSCFLNTLANPTATSRFANISAASGLDFADDGRAIAVVDWDHDGDLDLWTTNRNAPRLRFLRNDAKSGNHFLAVRLTGNGKTTSRDAIGARVEVITRKQSSDDENDDKTSAPHEERRAIKTLRAGEGFLAQSSKWLHFGLGAANGIEKVIVHWPDGEEETFTGMDIDGRYRLAQDSGKAIKLKRIRDNLTIRPSTLLLPPTSTTARIPLATLFTLPAENYQGLDGSLQFIPLDRGQSVLINLWSSWCLPCLAELEEFTQRAKEIRASGVEIVALNVDLLADDPAKEAAVKRLVKKMAIPFSVGFASPKHLAMLQMFHDQIVPLKQPLPLPSSFLLDADGHLTAIYKGTVSVDELLADVRHTKGTLSDRQRYAAMLPGRLLENPILIRTVQMEQSKKLFKMAEKLRRMGRIGDEITHYKEALQVRPDYAEAHFNLGNALAGLRRNKEAAERYEEALKIKPDWAEAHNNLGNVLKALGRPQNSLVHFQKALRIKPDWAEAHVSWGNALAILDRKEDAVAHYQEGLRIKPHLAEAHNNLSIVLKAMGRTLEARTHEREAQRIKSGGRGAND